MPVQNAWNPSYLVCKLQGCSFYNISHGAQGAGSHQLYAFCMHSCQNSWLALANKDCFLCLLLLACLLLLYIPGSLKFPLRRSFRSKHTFSPAMVLWLLTTQEYKRQTIIWMSTFNEWHWFDSFDFLIQLLPSQRSIFYRMISSLWLRMRYDWIYLIIIKYQ